MIMPVGVQHNRFLLLYASQTGQAKAIAEEIAEKADGHNLQADLHCISETEKKFFIEREKCVVIVTSTTGDGEPPDTALKFFRRIKKKTLPDDYLSHLNYALLGLGDSNYTNFCNCGKNLDHRLQGLGAKRFYESGWGDDAVGLEIVVEPWMESLFPAIKQFLGHSQNANPANIAVTPVSESINLSESINHVQTDIERSLTNITITPALESGDASNTVIKRAESNGIDADSSVAKNNGEVNLEQNGDSSVTNEKIASINTAKPEVIQKENDVTNTDNCNISRLETKRNTNSVGLNMDKSNTNENCSVENHATNTSDKELNTGTLKANQNNSNEKCGTYDKSTDSDVSVLSAAFQSGMDFSREATLKSEDDGVRKSLPPLSEAALSVPVAPSPYLKIEFQPDKKMHVKNLPLQTGASFPSAASPVAMARVASSMTLTTPTAMKKTILVDLDITGTGLTYQPGDSFSLICPNIHEEVNMLLKRLGLMDRVDTTYRLCILPDTKKKNASVPKHIHECGTLHHTLVTCVDIREPPKKALLRALVDYTEDPSEKRRLQELCSKQGAGDYTKYIREPNLSVVDLLHHFKSCQPPIERILEHCPRLQPRPYSVSSSPLTSPDRLSFVFNVIDIPPENGRSHWRKGVATGWLESIQSLQQTMDRMNISNEIKVPIFTRTNQSFHLPDDVTTPLILIGPGTGVAPFIGFLDHLAAQRQAGNKEKWGDVWLFFGCRHRSRDFLFRERLEEHQANSTISKLLLSFSRDQNQSEGCPHYVQDNIRSHSPDLVKLLDEEKAVVYVCGDAKNMARDVNEAFIEIVSKEKGIGVDEARKYMMKLRLERRYKEDVWT